MEFSLYVCTAINTPKIFTTIVKSFAEKYKNPRGISKVSRKKKMHSFCKQIVCENILEEKIVIEISTINRSAQIKIRRKKNFTKKPRSVTFFASVLYRLLFFLIIGSFLWWMFF